MGGNQIMYAKNEKHLDDSTWFEVLNCFSFQLRVEWEGNWGTYFSAAKVDYQENQTFHRVDSQIQQLLKMPHMAEFLTNIGFSPCWLSKHMHTWDAVGRINVYMSKLVVKTLKVWKTFFHWVFQPAIISNGPANVAVSAKRKLPSGHLVEPVCGMRALQFPIAKSTGKTRLDQIGADSSWIKRHYADRNAVNISHEI